MDSCMNRRSFVCAAAAVGVGAACTATALAGEARSSAADDAAASPASSAKKEHRPSETVDCDVVVVGSGTGGTCAALRAAELGAKVVLLEKREVLGGSSYFTEGVGAIGSRLQKEQGIEIDIPDVYRRLQVFHHNAALGGPLMTYLQNSGATIDWMMDNGATFTTVFGVGDSIPAWHLPGTPTELVSVGDAVLTPLQERLQGMADVRTQTPATDLIVEDGRVTGVYATDADGNEIRFNASRGVVLASGGYTNNKELFEEFTRFNHDDFYPWGVEGRDGDGIRMAREAVGAEMHCPGAVMYVTGHIVPSNYLGMDNSLFTFQPNFRVNEAGKRYFDESYCVDFSMCANALLTQHHVVSILDQAQLDALQTDGPVMQNMFIGGPVPNATELCEQSEAVVVCDTLEELAEKLDIDPEGLAASVERYNGFCETGVDEDFGKPAEYLQPISTPPYYGAVLHPDMFTTVGGIKVNENLQVIDTEGHIVDGLYAVGSDAGAIYGADYDVGVMSGSQQGWASTGGKLAAEHIMA